MSDGEEFEAGPGEVTSLPSGHDAWVVGDEPVVLIDWWGAMNYGKEKTTPREFLKDIGAHISA